MQHISQPPDRLTVAISPEVGSVDVGLVGASLLAQGEHLLQLGGVLAGGNGEGGDAPRLRAARSRMRSC